MARKKKRKKASRAQEIRDKGSEVFNPAFSGLTSLLKEKGSKAEAKVRPPQQNKRINNDVNVFLEAMSDVEPLAQKKKMITRVPNIGIRPSHPAMSEELKAMAHLSDLVAGNAEMDMTFTDEYIEGSIQGFNRELTKRLKKGEFPIQDYVDLHGLSKQDAKIKVRDFLLQSQRLGLRCVLVVHGRGLNSKNHIPVLKERLPIWLNRGPVRKIVLAFSTARPYDGGTGAIYVLLRKTKTGA